ncbi:Hypothetical protein J6898_01545 [Nakaseomyces glabratus]
MFRYLSRTSTIYKGVIATSKTASTANVVAAQESRRNYANKRNNNRNGPADALDEKLNSILSGKTSSKRKPYGGRKSPVDETSPWYAQLCALDDCLTTTLKQSATPMRKLLSDRVNHPDMRSNPTFWHSVSRAMSLYNELKQCPEMTDQRVTSLVHLLHNGLRTDRQLVSSLNKKPDYDSQSFHKEMVNFIYTSLNEISDDILNNNVPINANGLMHLFTSYQEMGFTDLVVQIWKKIETIAEQNPQSNIGKISKHPNVVGIVLPILYEKEIVNFSEAEKLFKECEQYHNRMFPNLYVGMILTSLKANENMKALELFETLCTNSKGVHYGYISETHIAFISQCKDISVAESFLDKAVNNEMPYRVEIQVSAVNSLMYNIWSENQDFNKIKEIWQKMVTFYGENNLRLAIFSSLNNEFFSYFFEKYKENKTEGLEQLQKLITQYNNLKGIDEPFLNIILAKCTVWKEPEVIKYIEKNFELFNVPKSLITSRILLKSLGSIDNITKEQIVERWQEIVLKADSLGSKYIANADWAALRDATVKWAQENKDNQESLDRIEWYLQIVNVYQKYCRDGSQRYRILKGCSKSFPILAENLQRLDLVDTSSIPVCEVKSLKEALQN